MNIEHMLVVNTNFHFVSYFTKVESKPTYVNMTNIMHDRYLFCAEYWTIRKEGYTTMLELLFSG